MFDWVTDHKIPFGNTMKVFIDFLQAHLGSFFDIVTAVVEFIVEGSANVLIFFPPIVVIVALAALAYALQRSWRLSLFVFLAFLFIWNQGYWEDTMKTISLVVWSAATSIAIGTPIGVMAAHRPRLYAFLHPILDMMQTLPTPVYLIPMIALLGIGYAPGLIATLIFALPAPIRLTHLGISTAPVALKEAGEAFGATSHQLLWKVELPHALPTIMAGVTQCIMLSLSMVVIAGMVGAEGLGADVIKALGTVNIARGFEAGAAIVLLAIVLDRMCRVKGAH